MSPSVCPGTEPAGDVRRLGRLPECTEVTVTHPVSRRSRCQPRFELRVSGGGAEYEATLRSETGAEVGALEFQLVDDLGYTLFSHVDQRVVGSVLRSADEGSEFDLRGVVDPVSCEFGAVGAALFVVDPEAVSVEVSGEGIEPVSIEVGREVFPAGTMSYPFALTSTSVDVPE